jgi:hypothetical protein
MPPRTSWRTLVPGLIALAALVALAVGLAVFGGVGKIRGEKMRLYVQTNQAQGVIGGTEVWLVGQKVGTVDGVGFSSPTADSAARVVLAVTVRADAAQQIRRDSDVQIRTGGNVIGPVVVALDGGTPTSPAVRDGDTLRARSQSDMFAAGAKMAGATKELGPIMTDVRTIMSRARSRGTTVRGSLTEEHGGEVTQLRSNVSRLRDLMAGATAAREGSQDVMAHARMAMARADSIRALIASPATSFGRFRRDSSLAETVGAVRDQLASLRAQMESPHGNMGRMKLDSAVTRALAVAQQEMTLLFTDIRKRPSRYIAF